MQRTILAAASAVLLYFLISLHFTNHFLFRTMINGVNVSLKAYDNADDVIRSHFKDYKIQLIEKDGRTEEISGQEIQLRYNPDYSFAKINRSQKSLTWITSLFKSHKYEESDLLIYDSDDLDKKIIRLECMNREVIESRNAGFRYRNGTYEVTKEVYGNEIDKDKLIQLIKMYIAKGKTRLNISESLCYIEPEYTVNSEKTLKTQNTLEKFISARITYVFGSKKEILDGTTINRWLHVDDNLDVTISRAAVQNYMKNLSSKYDTVGTARNFKASSGKNITVEGGLYGWRIDQKEEAEALTENIRQGAVLEKEPLYIQKALSWDKDEIGNTYVEINITRQQLWFYKDGKLIVSGPVVTGNPNRGNATVTGIYILNYKQKDTSLEGVGYDVRVAYWMPFFGNMGIHDASWRYSFGGEIYKRNGTHGCVNAPLFLAKAIYENIEEGVPIIIYEE